MPNVAGCAAKRMTASCIATQSLGLLAIEEDKMTRKGAECELLQHTRVDPRWEGARVNLEDQWKQIMSSMANSPKDCVAMQEAVMRFAAQPATFGIKDSVAERCATTFLAE